MNTFCSSFDMENQTNCPASASEKPSLSHKFAENPFLKDLKVRGKIKTRIMHAPSADRFIGVAEGDEGTGDAMAVVQRFKLDEEQFVKVYTRFFSSWFDMSKTAQKIFQAVLSAIQARPNEDQFWLSPEDVTKSVGIKSRSSIHSGLLELVELKIIAPSARGSNWWYCNPQYIFNGDRLSFYTEFQRVKRAKDTDKNQLTLFEPESGRLVLPDVSGL